MWTDDLARVTASCLRAGIVAACLVWPAVPSFGAQVSEQDLGPSKGYNFKLEAERYIRSHNQCGQSVTTAASDGASGGYGVLGLDCSGDWIQLQIQVPEPIVYSYTLCSAGDTGLRRKFSIEIVPSGSAPVFNADTITTPPGTGYC